MNALLLSGLFALAPVTTIAPGTPGHAQDPALHTGEPPDIKGAVDQSIRWLRSRQDPATGAYGSHVETTAWVLRALAVSPRQYVRQDGPFVARAIDFLLEHAEADGTIADEGADAAERLVETRASAAALAHYADADTRETLAAALAWLAEQGVDDPNADLAAFADDKTGALRRTVELLAARDSEGTWDGEGGRVLVTAQRIVELSSYASLLKPPREQREAHALPRFDEADAREAGAAILAGARFLMAASEDGRWGAPGQPDAGMTAMVISALQAVPKPRPKDIQEAIDSGLDWLLELQHEDGSIHDGKLANYITSAAIMALARAVDSGVNTEERDARYRKAVERARHFLIVLQADEGEGYSPDHHYYGGIGYGGDERPDLSNLQMALEALSVSGLDKDHAAFARAVSFLERCQNRSESNTLELESEGAVFVGGDDGGAAYMPGNSPAGYLELEDGRKVPRSYGSMTYALLKGYVFAGLSKDDPRVKACFDWLQQNYTLDVNPGFEYAPDPTAAYQGLFYYFHTMARALDLYGASNLVDGQGKPHAWRKELAGRLVAMQNRTDGSWVNENAPRWWEGNPVLATSYALLTLDSARPGDSD